jgi:hypothetical protein
MTTSATETLTAVERLIVVDKQWSDDSTVTAVTFENHFFERVSAKKVRFENVAFRYSTFQGCYLRSCEFVSCDFTGCKFVGSNLNGSNFTDCDFKYALFERTVVGSNLLDDSPPRQPNQRLWFARTLRANYQSLGNTDDVNKAMLLELEATRLHLKKAWASKDRYYRGKYKGLERAVAFARWAGFNAGHYAWGNGERPWSLIRTIVGVIFILAALDTLVLRDPLSVSDWIASIIDAAQVFLGTKQPEYPGIVLALIALTRYIALGLFVSVVVRRYARR